MSIDQLTAEALALPFADRFALAQSLWESIHDQDEFPEDPDVIQEAIRRAEELTSGKVVGLPWEEVLRDARRSIGCD